MITTFQWVAFGVLAFVAIVSAIIIGSALRSTKTEPEQGEPQRERLPYCLPWQVCPVCQGKGSLPCDFYENQWVASSTYIGRGAMSGSIEFPILPNGDNIQCRSCEGRGVLLVKAEEKEVENAI